MKPILTVDDVKKALNTFIAEGKKPTLVALHAALGHRGSMSTLVRLKAEIEAASQPINDSPEGLKIFREIWALAVNEGRRQREGVIEEVRDNLNGLASENERLEGAKLAAEGRAAELEEAASRAQGELAHFRLRAEKELDEARTAFATTSAQAAAALEKLSEAQATYACQIATLQAERAAAVQNAHSLELKLAHAQGILDAKGLSEPGSSNCAGHP
jgi:hypothetical protein